MIINFLQLENPPQTQLEQEPGAVRAQSPDQDPTRLNPEPSQVCKL